MSFKCSSDLYENIKEAAEDLGISMSDFCRMSIIKNLPDKLP